MKEITNLSLVALLLVYSSCYSDEPKIEKEFIRFSNGEKISFDKISKPITIKEWEKVLVIKTSELYEDYQKTLSIYRFDSTNVLDKFVYIGTEIIFKKHNRILLAQKSAHRKIGESFLLDSDGKLLKKVAQSENIIEINKSDDEQIFWILSSTIEMGTALIIGKVYDFNGNLIDNFKTQGNGKKIIIHEGKRYEIPIAKAEIPG